ncbi:MAG: nicotinamide riboside transporter PnuC [Gammaproteobacteria bacterium TMED134]|nr:MAG: nicotinamide riboside transporter PnuC [Gammaproteobacteria bacterium TMED134]RZO69825.1 MAG: nicotinamide riboside transporter PnuC [OM182 bacterium]HBK18110.1 aminotransferase [Gammaproteobacteria bacterium]|tara:strand:- start:6155 stop:6781 length:627 start_codon:yes stop_codon:yes gene_type:complete
MDYLAANWLEVIGVVSGLLCVLLLIKQNALTFPLGLLYALVTVIVVARSNLYADVILNAYYVLMNAYGWYYWLYGGEAIRDDGHLPPQPISRNLCLALMAITVLGSLSMAYVLGSFTAADLVYADSFTTVASFVAMWMTARKLLASWAAWFVIDVVQIAVYLVKGATSDPGLYLYAGLYTVYLGMAVIGWRAWRRTMVSDNAPMHAAG